MRSPIFILGATVALGACSTFASSNAPVCDGRYRRPANLYGSVLVPTPVPDAPYEAQATSYSNTPTDIQTPISPAPASAPQGGCA